MIKTDELSTNAKGGTELLKGRLQSFIDKEYPDLMDTTDIYFSRVRDFNPNRSSIYYMHDLSGDPEVAHLKTRQHKFNSYVFVSEWQRQQYMADGLIDTTMDTRVISNSITRSPDVGISKFLDLGSEDNPIRVIYHTTPHRGLNILAAVWPNVIEWCKSNKIHIKLDVYSSFAIYGWAERDGQYRDLFECLKGLEGVTLHGTVSNEEIRNVLKQTHIFAFPSIWQETGCLALMEAMYERNLCVHSNLAALPETSGGLNYMYPYNPYTDTLIEHAQVFCHNLIKAIQDIRDSTPDGSMNIAIRTLEARKHIENKHIWETAGQTHWRNLFGCPPYSDVV